MMLAIEGGPTLVGIEVSFLEVLGWTGLSLAIILLLRVLLAVLRSEADTRER